MREVMLDFSQCGSRYALHQELAEKLDFPAHYGYNLDALWDCLTESAVEKTLLRLEKAPDFARGGPDLEEYYRRLLEVLQDAAKENPCIRVCQIGG